MLSVDNSTIMQLVYMQLSNYSHLGLAPFFYGMPTFHDSVILTLDKINSQFIFLPEMLHNMELKWIVIYFLFLFICISTLVLVLQR